MLFGFNENILQKGRTVSSIRPTNCCPPIHPTCFLNGFPGPSKCAAVKHIQYSSKPQRPADSLRPTLCRLLSRYVHVYPYPNATTKYPCPVCTCNVTGRCVSDLCNRFSGRAHSKCSGFQNAAEYQRITRNAIATTIRNTTPVQVRMKTYFSLEQTFHI